MSSRRSPFPELDGNVANVVTGGYHTLVLTKDGKLYAFGHGRRGALGSGPTSNGFRAIPEMTDVVSMAGGI